MPMMGSLRGMARQGAWSIHVDDRAGTGNEQLGNSQGLSLRPPQSTTKLGKCLVSLPGSGPGEELLESCAWGGTGCFIPGSARGQGLE